MNIFGEVLLSMMMLVMSHEGGHISKAYEVHANINFKGTNWTTKAEGTRLVIIAGAGFEAQDKTSRDLNSEMYKLVNASHKISYLIVDRGDLYSIGKTKGKKSEAFAKGVLITTAISDVMSIYQPDNGWNFVFVMADNGTPLLGYSINF
ncbi:MAG: hypothetical protein KAS32_01740 [Candidatus Peribacteraceae bacterium]|nr:hypothetical protein [Candidatus Peribacteraceae bacterium]